MDWDADAQEEALRRARSVQKRDPEAAALLAATLVATQEIQEEQGEVVDRSPLDYNPIEIYDVACKEYGWRPRDIDEMHYLTFFAMMRAASERHKRDQEELDKIRSS